MISVRKHRLFMIAMIFVLLSGVVALILYALRQNINLYYTPSQILAGQAPFDRVIRAGGMVVKGSILRNSHDLTVRFKLTDYRQTIDVMYQGILPDLFREGQGVVTLGTLAQNHEFKATQVLAKHDEKYMPPEVRSTLSLPH